MQPLVSSRVIQKLGGGNSAINLFKGKKGGSKNKTKEKKKHTMLLEFADIVYRMHVPF